MRRLAFGIMRSTVRALKRRSYLSDSVRISVFFYIELYVVFKR